MLGWVAPRCRHSPEVRGQRSELGVRNWSQGSGSEFTRFLVWLLSVAAVAQAALESRSVVKIRFRLRDRVSVRIGGSVSVTDVAH